jgi:transposase-like protein
MIERKIQVDHSTIIRWVHQYSPEIEKKIRRPLRQQIICGKLMKSISK